MASIILTYCMDFFRMFVVASPGLYARTFLNFYEYFSFSLTWDSMGGGGIQNGTPPDPRNRSRKFPNFSCILKILKIQIRSNRFYSRSLTWTQRGVNISKRYCSYKSQAKIFKVVLNFLPNGLTKLGWEFLNFDFPIFNDFFSKISNSPL